GGFGGGFNLGGIGGGGFNLGGFGGGGLVGGGAIIGGVAGGFGFGNFQGGTFQGGFNGSLGVMGASQAAGLIQVITRVVAPGEWFVTTQPNPFQPQFQFLGGQQ